MHLRRLAIPSAILLAAACNRDVTVIPPKPATEGQAVRARMVNGRVLDADTTAKPNCPIRISYEAELTVSRLIGKLQYQWVRSTGEKTSILELDIPETARNGEAVVTVKPDIWTLNDPGVQHNYNEYVHILSPIDTRTFQTGVDAMCY